jgi:alanyl-tRNA synthetase
LQVTPEETRTHSALHVLKGAVQKTLGANLTASTFVQGGHGRLTVKFDRKPTPEEEARLLQLTNQKVAEGVEVIEFEMDKEEAEGHFGNQIYDLFPIPAGVSRLKIVRIPDWNVNCCIERHVENTSMIGKVRLGKLSFRNSRKELEIEFDLA